MAPTVFLISLLTTHNTIKSTTTTNVSPSSAISRTTVSSNFGVYQQTSIGSSSISIRTLVLDVISADPYRKALIAKLFLHQIMIFSDTHSVSFSNLISTVVSYFGLNTGFAERETDTTTIDIRNNFILVYNLQNLGFSDVSDQPITISDPDRHPADLTYFKFCSIVSTTTVANLAQVSSLSLKFSLRLSQSLNASVSNLL